MSQCALYCIYNSQKSTTLDTSVLAVAIDIDNQCHVSNLKKIRTSALADLDKHLPM